MEEVKHRLLKVEILRKVKLVQYFDNLDIVNTKINEN